MSEKRSWADLADGELVQIYQAKGADVAFAELVRRYQVRVFRVLIGITRDANLAEELCQRTFVKAALSLHQIRDGQAFYAWLLTIARSQALDELRRPARTRRENRDASTVLDTEEQHRPDHELRNAVHRVLEQLDPEERAVLILADLEQLSMKELATSMDIELSAAKMRLSRARDHFRALYTEQT